MENKFNVLFNNALKYGAAMGGVIVLFNLIVYVSGTDLFSITFSILSFVVVISLFIVFFVYSNRNLRDKHFGGQLTYLEGFLNALITGVVALLITTAYSYLFFKFFDPEYLQQTMEKTMEMLESNPNIPQDTLDDAYAKIEKMTPEKVAIQGLYSNAIISLIFAAIVAAFTKMKAPVFSDEEDEQLKEN
ncbi:MAG: DUF4199 domain-containing protein [Bacteroidales bacterium]|jgi:hypothetical protein|nr:DUF4199 domain-containing protein [Bacteroidales bacterium]